MIVLRPARSTDAGKVGAILTEFVETTDWMPRLHSGAEDVAHAGEMIERGWVTVAEQGGRVVAFAACDAGAVDALYAAGDVRRSGLGAALMEHLQQHHERLTVWTCQINEAARRFYERCGFVEIARTDGAENDEKLPDIQYEWRSEVV